MKEVARAAGIRTPRRFRGHEAAGCARRRERIGYPVIVKPIAGAGSMDTYRVDERRRSSSRAAAPRPRRTR